jgi:uncharacterized protein (TIGR00255 family)
MIKSMTAFARKQTQADWGTLSVEIKSVNHRYLEMNFRMPESVRELEMAVRELCKKQLQRGKLDITVRYTPGSTVTGDVNVNEKLVAQLCQASEQIASSQTTLTAANVMDVLRWPGVMQIMDADLTEMKQALTALIEEALLELTAVRAREGESLAAHIVERLDGMCAEIDKIVPRQSAVVEQQRQKLQDKISDMQVKLDDERLEQEIAILAQRVDVAEELDRLQTHITEARRVMKKGGVVGRRLDFLMQEFNREANTLASKSIDSAMTQAAVEIKVLIEQMREQIQNLE